MGREEKKRLTRIREQTGREYLELLPGAMNALREIINDPEANPGAAVQAIGMLMDRGLGKPEENIRIRHQEDNMELAHERLEEILAQVRKDTEGSQESED